MGWAAELEIEREDIEYPKAEYIITASGNKVSRKSVLCGSQNIVLNGKTIIMQGCVLRGDLSNIKLGKYCIVDKGVVIRPPFKKFIKGCAFFPVALGDFCFVGENTMMNAATVGSFVKFGKNCYIGRRCVIKDCVIIDDNSIVPEGTVMPPFTRWAGAPARVVEELPDSFAMVLADAAKEYYDHFKPVGKELPGWGSALGKIKMVRALSSVTRPSIGANPAGTAPGDAPAPGAVSITGAAPSSTGEPPK